jgi:bacillithiol system protein YtxJ
MNWINIENSQEIDNILEQSKQIPCLIFKHSTRCHMSEMSKYIIENEWNLEENQLKAYCLDILKYKDLAIKIAEQFNEHHQSPQVLLIQNGECFYEESHLSISYEEIEEEINFITG